MFRGDGGVDEVGGSVGAAEVLHSFVESVRVLGDSPYGSGDALLRISILGFRGTPGFRIG